MSAKETAKRYLAYFLNIAFISLSVALSVRADLGITPTASVCYIVNAIYPRISVGTATFIMNVLILLAQILIQRKDFKKIQLLQIPGALVIGLFTDGYLALLAWLTPQSYPERFALLLLSILAAGLGVFLCVSGRVLMNPSDGLLTAIADKTKVEYGKIKVINDVIYVSTTIVASLVFLGRLDGVREGTILSALLIGNVARLLARWFAQPLERFYKR